MPKSKHSLGLLLFGKNDAVPIPAADTATHLDKLAGRLRVSVARFRT